MKSDRLTRLHILSKERLSLKHRIEEIKIEETKLVESCTHSYDDGSNAWKPISDSTDKAHVMYCVICNRYVRIGRMAGYVSPAN